MALDTSGLQAALRAAFEDMASARPEDQASTASDAATLIADAIDTYVKTAVATVNIPAGSVVIAAAPIASPVLNPTPIPLSGGPDSTPPGGLS